jgi:hypothetical protein
MCIEIFSIEELKFWASISSHLNHWESMSHGKHQNFKWFFKQNTWIEIDTKLPITIFGWNIAKM